MELLGSSETEVSVKKVQCVGCTVLGMWTKMSHVDILLKHFKCGLQQKRTVPDVVLVLKKQLIKQIVFVLMRFFPPKSNLLHIYSLRNYAFDACTG